MLTPDSITPEQAARFWSKVDRSGGTDACWPWTGYKNTDGYGRVNLLRRAISAHRVAYTLGAGCIPVGLCVCHRCDNPACCRPDHLFLGTHLENIADMDAKGRRVSATGDRGGARKHPETLARGTRNAAAKLTERDIPEIRAALARGETKASVALRYNVSAPAIGYIARGHTWRHVP